MENTVWVLGDAVIDLVPDNSNSYLKCPGGAPANVAVGIARLGVKVHLLVGLGKTALAVLCSRFCSRKMSILVP